MKTPVSLFFAVVFFVARFALADEAADKHFAERAWPLLETRCVSCHGAETQEGGLRLDSREAVLRGGKQGPAVHAAKPDESLLLASVRHADPKLAMPPKEKLSAVDIATLERWVRDGAPWPTRVAPATTTPTKGDRIGDAWHDKRNPIVRLFRGERLDLWSLKPVATHPLPEVKHADWARSPLDQFILARLEAEGLRPAPEADRRTLARRVYFDLVGLPPTPTEIERFLADSRTDAYERLVEEWLASPRHGEHVARMWLDVIRYSDSNGFDWDEFRPRAWLFRDYVVRSLNADKPYDQFLREQLAGDELLPGPPRNAAEQDMLIATGYLRLGPHDNAAGLFNEQDRSRAEWMADLVETTGSAFLGLTFSCCRCHDHKFDPLSQADHFRLRGFFEPLQPADDMPLDLAADQAAIAEHNAGLDAEIGGINEKRKALREAVKQRLIKEGIEKPADEQVSKALSDDEKAEDAKLVAAVKELNGRRRNLNLGLLVRDSSGDVAATRILYQGDHKSPREAVEAGFISALDPNPAKIGKAPNEKSKGRRLALANWIASPDNPLAARVLVNRVWQLHFGRGLVATPNDFGLAGARPTHPELLDWLAGEFVRQGWSLKELQRQIVLSATYRQSSVERDSSRSGKSNGISSVLRQNARRLTAEQLRDALLSVSGLANGKWNGPPVWPELPVDVLQANPAFLDDNATKTKGWYPSAASEQDARSLFLVQKRTVRIPFLELFDLPENSTSCARRNTSTVAPQAFTLLNSPLAVRAAQSFAARVKHEAGDDPRAQLHRAFVLALQREPTGDEQAACLGHLESRGLVAVCRVLLNLNEFVFVD